MTESIISGLDRDGILKVETIDFYMSSLAAEGNGGLRFDWSLDEAVAKHKPRVIVIVNGEVTVLKSAFQNDASPDLEDGIRKLRTVPSGEAVDLPR